MNDEVKRILEAAGEDPYKIFAGMNLVTKTVLKASSGTLGDAEDDKPNAVDDFWVWLAKMQKAFAKQAAKIEESIKINKELLILLENMILAFGEWKKSHTSQMPEIRKDAFRLKSYIDANDMYLHALVAYQQISRVNELSLEALQSSKAFLPKP